MSYKQRHASVNPSFYYLWEGSIYTVKVAIKGENSRPN